jgi:hypothetical protein
MTEVYLSAKEIRNVKNELGDEVFNEHFEPIGFACYGRDGYNVSPLESKIICNEDSVRVVGVGMFYPLDEDEE